MADRSFVNVLNLIITGIPSIQKMKDYVNMKNLCFKPYYNWNTFNTHKENNQ